METVTAVLKHNTKAFWDTWSPFLQFESWFLSSPDHFTARTLLVVLFYPINAPALYGFCDVMFSVIFSSIMLCAMSQIWIKSKILNLSWVGCFFRGFFFCPIRTSLHKIWKVTVCVSEQMQLTDFGNKVFSICVASFLFLSLLISGMHIRTLWTICTILAQIFAVI